MVKPTPGVSRESRIDEEGLARLERQLTRGANISPMVLSQWIRRYGEPARVLLRKYDLYAEKLEPDECE